MQEAIRIIYPQTNTTNNNSWEGRVVDKLPCDNNNAFEV